MTAAQGPVTAARRPRIGVLASGNGSNLQAIIDACADDRLRATVAIVVVDRPGCGSIERAERAHIAIELHDSKNLRGTTADRSGWEAAIELTLRRAGVDLVVLAGWRMVLSARFVQQWTGRILNLHPALPGELPGLHAIERAHAEAVVGLRTQTGVMVHHVIAAVDAGPVVRSRTVAMSRTESLTNLQVRIHAVEHEVLIEAIAAVLAPAVSPG